MEEMTTRVAFENTGNFIREQNSRVKVQTDAGVKHWGLLSFPFASATETIEIDYVRVRKADGSTIVTPPGNAQDLDAEITRAAPFYSDQRERHVAVKGLATGDVLEYQAHWHATKPLAPGQFWFLYNFHREGIVLDEKLEIRVPAERAVKARGPNGSPTITTEGSSRVYSWRHSELENVSDPAGDEKKQIDSALGRVAPPDVQLSSFQSWDEVGRWYWNLQKDRIEPSAAIRAKAAELTSGITDDDAKLRALYKFVSTQYRYIGISFGIGRYQPHSADDVLSNNYGDCKDKHTLLAALLQASGFTLYPALISSTEKIDPDVPSPAQFNHVIGYLSPGRCGSTLLPKSRLLAFWSRGCETSRRWSWRETSRYSSFLRLPIHRIRAMKHSKLKEASIRRAPLMRRSRIRARATRKLWSGLRSARYRSHNGRTWCSNSPTV
jgi:hypothetical protein